MLRRLIPTIVQTRGIKQTVKINWVRPEYVPSYKPEKSGDLETVSNIPLSSLPIEYALSEEMKDAPESVRKLCSVGHLGRQEFSRLVRNELMERVRRHNYDDTTEETRIARLTGYIRCLQQYMDQYPRNVKAKVACQQIIDKRKKLLKFLRQADYKKFEWILEKLNIEYKAYPESHHKLSRRESLRKLTELHCEEIRNNKLNNYRNQLESQQGPFLQKKLEALKFIRSEQEELEIPITVTSQDIKKVEKQLEEWTVRNEIKKQATKKKKNIALDLE